MQLMATETNELSPSTNTSAAAAAMRGSAVAPSEKRLWAGRISGGLAIAFLSFDVVIKLLKVPEAVKGTIELGYPETVIVPLGVVLLACLVLYVIPRTAVVGAVLLTGYFGGAIATHVRVGNSLFGHILFPVYVAILVWGSLYLRDARVRALLGAPDRA